MKKKSTLLNLSSPSRNWNLVVSQNYIVLYLNPGQGFVGRENACGWDAESKELNKNAHSNLKYSTEKIETTTEYINKRINKSCQNNQNNFEKKKKKRANHCYAQQ